MKRELKPINKQNTAQIIHFSNEEKPRRSGAGEEGEAGEFLITPGALFDKASVCMRPLNFVQRRQKANDAEREFESMRRAKRACS
ncbi:MAG: hypothetical protein ALAOOOJD_03721 [bacterium]|nr:hypothetical protein [bacterium]